MSLENKISFALKKKALASSYSNSVKIKNYFNKSGSPTLTDFTSITEGSQLDKYFARPGSQLDNCIVLSNTLYDTNRIYQEIIDYFATMYLIRYRVTPRRIKDSKLDSKETYKKHYQNMLEYVDGLSLETLIPLLLMNIFKNGQIFIYGDGNTSSKTINTIILPNKYCRSTVLTQFGTQQIQFDFSFFDSLGLTPVEKESLIELFPDEFAEKYRLYLNDMANSRWQELDARYSTCISQNEDGFPTFLAIAYDLVDYRTYKMNSLDRDTNTLEYILGQEIDLEKTKLDMKEVKELHDGIADTICSNKGATLVTTVGKLSSIPIQSDPDMKNLVAAAYDSIYDNAGLNKNLFNGDSEESLEFSRKRDELYVWSFIERIISFYNLVANNVKSFGPYQLSLKILPITAYNESEKLECLHKSATLGVGVLDYIVASGTKQIDLESELELEESLDLVNRLVPLQSSHTQSSTSTENKEDIASDSGSKEDVNKDSKSDVSNKDEEKEGEV